MLLLNILPREISEALKTEPRAIAAHYDEASILFADIVEFTPMAATMLPLTLVDLLNDVFECFDDLVDRYDLEKIKTIGDCYMVATRLSHRHQLRPGGRGRHRSQKIHLRPLGRDGKYGQPHGVARAKRRHPNHSQYVRPCQR
jgi:class 3 adenylate cyclase